MPLRLAHRVMVQPAPRARASQTRRGASQVGAVFDWEGMLTRNLPEESSYERLAESSGGSPSKLSPRGHACSINEAFEPPTTRPAHSNRHPSNILLVSRSLLSHFIWSYLSNTYTPRYTTDPCLLRRFYLAMIKPRVK